MSSAEERDQSAEPAAGKRTSPERRGPERRSSDRRGAAARRGVVERRGGMERRRGPGRRRSEIRRAAEEGEITDELLEFVMAIDEYKRANEKSFPSWSEVFEVVKYLGYRKVADKGTHIDKLSAKPD